jgi:hypothetical protein
MNFRLFLVITMSKSHKIKEEYHVRDLTIDDQYDIIGPDASIVEAAKNEAKAHSRSRCS